MVAKASPILDTAEHQWLHLYAESRSGILRFLNEEPVGGITSIGQVGYAREGPAVWL